MGVILLVVGIIVCHNRKRTRYFRALATSESQVEGIHTQDPVLLNKMRVLSKNPHYYSSELDSSFVNSLETMEICPDKLKLLEDIGEGAFGKVFKGGFILYSDATFNTHKESYLSNKNAQTVV